MKHIDLKEFRDLVKKGIAPSKLISKQMAQFNRVDYETRRVKFLASTESPDRAGDVVIQSGINFENYLKNPVVLFQHQQDDFPIGKCVDIQITQQGLEVEFELVPADFPIIGAKAEAILRSLQAGFLNAVSIGFLPLSYEFTSDPSRDSGMDFKSIELFEISIVSVPCLPSALIAPIETSQPDIQPETEAVEEKQLGTEFLKFQKMQQYIAAIDTITDL